MGSIVSNVGLTELHIGSKVFLLGGKPVDVRLVLKKESNYEFGFKCQFEDKKVGL